MRPLHCRSYPATVATGTAVMSNDPLMTSIKSQLQSKRSQGDSAMLGSHGSGSRSVDLSSFGSQGSVQFDALEFLRPCGEGSFGKVSHLWRWTVQRVQRVWQGRELAQANKRCREDVS